MDSLPQTLYKYLAPARADAVAKRLLRFSPLSAFNDPFEGRPHVTALVPDGEASVAMQGLLPSELKRAYDGLPSDVRSHLSCAAFIDFGSQLAAQQEGDLAKLFNELAPHVTATIQRKFDDLIGILSLSEVPDSLLMWSHYAASHTGFVIGFEPRHSYFNQSKGADDEFRHLRRVMYREARPRGALTSLDGTDLFLVKSSHWAYEREWRILRPTTEADFTISATPFPIHLFEYPADALKEVIIGARMDLIVRAALLSSIAAEPSLAHVRIKQAVPHSEHFILSIEEAVIGPGR